mgnify:CR=1 FL=1
MEPNQYNPYARAIRREYAQFDDATYSKGRAAALQRLLSSRTLYRTPQFRAKYEQQARANLRREIDQLRGASGASAASARSQS